MVAEYDKIILQLKSVLQAFIEKHSTYLNEIQHELNSDLIEDSITLLIKEELRIFAINN